jgi:Rrf2 family cysteine metabolism transcriptional repressor
MKLSPKNEYLCLALVDLVEHYEKGIRTTTQIAEKQEIPKKFLEQILLSLKH